MGRAKFDLENDIKQADRTALQSTPRPSHLGFSFLVTVPRRLMYTASAHHVHCSLHPAILLHILV